MRDLGKALFFAGVVMAMVGGFVWAYGQKNWFGALPGDIRVSRGNFHFYLPVVTCLIISVALTLLIWLLRR